MSDDRPTPTCPPDEQLAAFYAGTLDEAASEAVRDHLASCEGCVDRAADARKFVDALAPSAEGRRIPAWWPAAAAIAGGLLVAWFVTMNPGSQTAPSSSHAAKLPAAPKSRWSRLHVDPPRYVPIDAGDEIVWRGTEQPKAVEGSLTWAMEPYARGDYEGALERLGQPRWARESPRTVYYSGICYLMMGHPDIAVDYFEMFADSRDALAHEAHYYLGIAHLKSGDEAKAIAELTPLAAETTDLGDRARKILKLIEDKSPR